MFSLRNDDTLPVVMAIAMQGYYNYAIYATSPPVI